MEELLDAILLTFNLEKKGLYNEAIFDRAGHFAASHGTDQTTLRKAITLLENDGHIKLSVIGFYTFEISGRMVADDILNKGYVAVRDRKILEKTTLETEKRLANEKSEQEKTKAHRRWLISIGISVLALIVAIVSMSVNLGNYLSRKDSKSTSQEIQPQTLSKPTSLNSPQQDTNLFEQPKKDTSQNLKSKSGKKK